MTSKRVMRAFVTASARRACPSLPFVELDLGHAVVVLCALDGGVVEEGGVASEVDEDAVGGIARLDLAHAAGENEATVVDEADGVAELFDLVHAVGGEEDVRPCLRRSTRVSMRRMALTGSRPLKGSSMMMSSGSWSSAAMNWIFCCMPLESSSVFLGIASVISMRSHQTWARLLAVSRRGRGAGRGR